MKNPAFPKSTPRILPLIRKNTSRNSFAFIAQDEILINKTSIWIILNGTYADIDFPNCYVSELLT